MHCDANGLKLAIEDALTQMKEGGADGFDYKIGEIEGMNLRIVAENEDACICDVLQISGSLTYTAVVETE